MNDVYALNARKIKVLEAQKKELEFQLHILKIKFVTIEFENRKLKRIFEKIQLKKEDKP